MDTAFRFHGGEESIHLSEGSQHSDRLRLQEEGGFMRHQGSGSILDQVEGRVRTSTPVEGLRQNGEDRGSKEWQDFLTYSAQELGRIYQQQRLREQANRDLARRAPEQGRREDWGGLLSSPGAHLLARQPSGRERDGQEKLQATYLNKFTRLKRRKAKLEAEMNSLSDIVESIVQEGCNKRKAELIEKDLDKMEDSLEKVTELHDGAVEEMPEVERREAIRDRDLSYESSDSWIRGARAKVRRYTKETPPRTQGPARSHLHSSKGVPALLLR